MLNKSHLDGAELFSRFATNWFLALADITVEHKVLYVMRMLRFIMDIFHKETLNAESLFTLHATFAAQVLPNHFVFIHTILNFSVSYDC